MKDVALDEDFVVPMVAGSELTYGFNWSDVLAVGETIQSSQWEIDNSAFVIVDTTTFGGYALAKIGGGVAGRVAYAKNTITTSEPNTFVKRIKLECIPG